MISVSNLVKRYGGLEAVKNVSFTVERDSILGFLGPNGAGKTTIMKILTGYHFPSEGCALINGISVEEDPVKVKSMIGYLPESAPLYGELTVNEYLGFIADARLIPASEKKAKINKALEQCSLVEKRNTKIETLSKGYRQRTGLAQAIIHDPEILILDEPTTGLDPNQIIEIRSLIKELGKIKTVVLSTHILQEVEAVCNQVLILNEGRIAAQGSPDSIAGTMKGGENWELVLKGASSDAVRGKLEGLALDGGLSFNIEAVEENPDATCGVRFFIQSNQSGQSDAGAQGEAGQNDGNANAEKIFDWAVQNGLKLFSMNRKKLSLEDIFVKLTRDSESPDESSDARSTASSSASSNESASSSGITNET